MRNLVLALGMLAAVTTTGPDAQLLLDLDLLHEADPRAQREQQIAAQRPLLEFLQRLERAAAMSPRPAPPPRPAERDC